MPTQKVRPFGLTFWYASLAQSVEHAAVNRGVVGSSPTGGAKVLPPQGGGNTFYKTPARAFSSVG